MEQDKRLSPAEILRGALDSIAAEDPLRAIHEGIATASLIRANDRLVFRGILVALAAALLKVNAFSGVANDLGLYLRETSETANERYVALTLLIRVAESGYFIADARELRATRERVRASPFVRQAAHLPKRPKPDRAKAKKNRR
jgi:hypothetical protein